MNDSGQEFIIYHTDFEQRLRPLMEGKSCIDVTTVGQDAKPKKVGCALRKLLAMLDPY